MLKFYFTIEPIFVPGLNNSQLVYKEKLSSLVSQEKEWLDVGCGHQLLPEWMKGGAAESAAIVAKSRKVVGMDLDFSSLLHHDTISQRVCADISKLPFRSNTFDLVTANMVVEHIENPAPVLNEVARILKPGGVFLFHTPNRLGYSSLLPRLLPEKLIPKIAQFLLGRKPEDVYRTFYRLNTCRTINAAARDVGLESVECRYLESSAQARMLGPVVVLELLLIRALRSKLFASLRTNIIAVLQKPYRR